MSFHALYRRRRTPPKDTMVSSSEIDRLNEASYCDSFSVFTNVISPTLMKGVVKRLGRRERPSG